MFRRPPYVEPVLRTLVGGLTVCSAGLLYLRPEWAGFCLTLLLLLGVDLLQSGFTRYHVMEKLLERVGLRREQEELGELSRARAEAEARAEYLEKLNRMHEVQEKRIAHMAMHDALTGLPNRVQLESQVEQALEHARRGDFKVALLFIDLDNFKQINDVQGHKAGDELLVSMSALMRGCLREGDMLVRWGGDEFVVLLPDAPPMEGVRQVAERLMQAVRKAQPTGVSLSIGAALFPDDAVSSESLLVQADKALFFAKAQGRDNIQFYGTMRHSGQGYREFDLAARLVAAVHQGLLEVHYQPVVDARSGAVVGLEALSRWHDETYGLVGPSTFIPMAESLGLIRELGEQIMDQALACFSERLEQGRGLFLSLNVSNRQQVTDDFARTLRERVARYGVRPEQVKLEITESIALEGVSHASRFLHELSEAGFRLSIDDFGTGFSSLSQLHTLPVDELKIDMSFVRRIRTREGRAIIKAIVDMAHDLELMVVAEGVEDTETADLLRALGVELLQGYLFGQPLPLDKCERFLAEASAPAGKDEGSSPRHQALDAPA
jgi:diguanylate cyclase (GGDEF)-like protein